MIKKIAILLALAFSVLGMNAQLPVGGWTIHSPFSGISKVVETKGMTYYLSAGSLFSIDKETNEVRALNYSNALNGGAIKDIFPQPDGKYLIVAYQNCNIDRLNDDGTVVNISDIYDALLTGKPVLNHVGFGKDRFYVATSFGLVTFDEKTNRTIETMFSPKPVEKVFVLGDNAMIIYDRQFYHAPAADHLVSIDKFTKFNSSIASYVAGELDQVISDNKVLLSMYQSNQYTVVQARADFDNNKIDFFFTQNGGNHVLGFNNITKMKDGRVMASNNNSLYLFTGETLTPEVVALPSSLNNHHVTAFEGMKEVWAGDGSGICLLDLSNPASPVQITDKFGKTEFSAAECNRVAVQPTGDILFWNEYDQSGLQIGFTQVGALKVAAYSRETGFRDVTPKNPRQHTTWICEDPNNSDVLYVGDWYGGLFRYENGELTHTITSANSTISSASQYRISYIQVDNRGNLWVFQEVANTSIPNIHYIPLTAFDKPEISQSEWTSMNVPDYTSRCKVALVLDKSPIAITGKGFWVKNLAFINHRNTQSTSDDKVAMVTSYVDQDSKTFSYYHINDIQEDKLGRVWVATNTGVYEITDPSKVTTDVAQINHLKVPRNDGTNLADYLLDAISVSAIAVDSSNRKWLATLTDGVYLVSPDGDQILEHYNSSNSVLPSNRVLGVACDPNSSSVFFATDAGVVEYNSTAAPASDNLDEVYAFPNPVRPEYSGWITVTGLMDNTLVKIADAAGNVFFQGRSEGGMITWDGCNAAGDRVKSGVYYVFASSGTAQSSGESCVTKIMVIN